MDRRYYNHLWMRTYEEAKKMVPKLSETEEITRLYPYYDENDVISETTTRVVLKLIKKPLGIVEDVGKYTRAAIKNEVADWVRYNNRKCRKDAQKRQSFTEETGLDIPTPILSIVAGFQTKPATPEELFMARELYDLAMKHFEEDDIPLLIKETTYADEAKRLGIQEAALRKRIQRKKYAFADDAVKAGWSPVNRGGAITTKIEKVIPARAGNQCPHCGTIGQTKGLKLIDASGYCNFCQRKVK